jgi:flagellar biosynthetic protein FlhB
MSESESDDSQKTEDPTQRRLDQAREKGQVAKSQEINHWFIFLGMAVVVTVFATSIASGVVRSLRQFLERPHAIRIDTFQLRELMSDTLAQIGLTLLLPVLVIVMVALAAGLVQNGLLFSFESLKPKLEKLSPIKGLKRQFSAKSLAEFVKGVAKITVVSGVITLLMWPNLDLIPNIAGMELTDFAALLRDMVARIVIAVLAVMTLIAALDFLFQKHQHRKQLRMTKQELKDEFKQSEGDPMVKSRLRQIRMERARKRMMAAVPEADVVITNPTHYAVALKYDSMSMNAPKLLAKGVDILAAKIREIANEHEIPIVENPPLTRALYQSVDLDQEIPPEHYKAVAEVIGYVMRLRGRLPRASARPNRPGPPRPGLPRP